MAEKLEKPKPAPVIRRLEVAEDDLHTRVLSRHLPAWVVSGAIHVVVMGVGILFLSAPKEAAATPDENGFAAQVESPPAPEDNLVNEDLGFDIDVPKAADVEKEAAATVDAAAADEPPGADRQADEPAPQTAVFGAQQPETPGTDGPKTDGPPTETPGTSPNLVGRTSGATKDKLIKATGGNELSEAAVAKGLSWLKRKQLKDGSWEYDGSSKANKVAATGMALLPFLAAGETHKSGKLYQKEVAAAVTWLTGKVGSGGMMSANMYEHAIGTVALCEVAGMTGDPAVKKKATEAVAYIVRAQSKDGSWGYTAGTDGDTSIVGWQIQALQSAKLAGIKFDKEKVYGAAEKFLNNVASDSGAKYGYREKGESVSLTPVGLLCRYYMGWTPKHPAFGRGTEFIKKAPPSKATFDMYTYYYATQVMHFYDGPDWHKFWNPKMRDMLIDLQNKSSDAALVGSWEKDGGFIGGACGRLGTTCLALLTLEVYYRHLPLYKRDNGGLAEMER